MEFIDLESGDKIKLNPAEIKSRYHEDSDAFLKKINLRCNQYKIDFIEVDVKSNFHVILETYLIKRSKMR